MAIWSNKFKEPDAEFPERVLIRLADSFEDVTENLASLRLHKLQGTARMVSGLGTLPFQFKLALTSNQLESYSFEVFAFGYNVTLYPVTMVFSTDIGNELGLSDDWGKRNVEVATQEDFEKLVTAALTSSTFNKTVGGLMKVARTAIEQKRKA